MPSCRNANIYPSVCWASTVIPGVIVVPFEFVFIIQLCRSFGGHDTNQRHDRMQRNPLPPSERGDPRITLRVATPMHSITAAVFTAFLKCPTKAHLLVIGESAPATFFSGIETRISSMYRSVASRRMRVGADAVEPLDFGALWSSRGHEAIPHPVDCETAVYNFVVPSDEPADGQSEESAISRAFVPVLYSPWDRPDVSANLLVCFGALALAQVTGILADTGTVIYGEGSCTPRTAPTTS
jgi:hypothetical protein